MTSSACTKGGASSGDIFRRLASSGSILRRLRRVQAVVLHVEVPCDAYGVYREW